MQLFSSWEYLELNVHNYLYFIPKLLLFFLYNGQIDLNISLFVALDIYIFNWSHRLFLILCCRHDAGSNRGLDVRAGGRGPVGGGGGPVGGGRGPVGGGRGVGDVGRSGDNRYLSSQVQGSYKFLVWGFIILLFRYRAYGL